MEGSESTPRSKTIPAPKIWSSGPAPCAFERVDFAYDPRRPILHAVSFDLPAGNTIAVVGTSGAGKSTLLRLLFRFYDVSGRRIAIDGQDIRRVTQKSLRRAAGLAVNDNAVLLAGAIPAAALALLIEGGFVLLDRWLIPAGLRHAKSP